MVKIDILDRGAFSSAMVYLGPGEQFMSEAGAMFRSSSNINVEVTTKSKGKGGLLGGLKRLLAGENFFFSTYNNTSGEHGEVGLAPTLQGEVKLIQADGGCKWVCAGGSYLASSTSLQVDTQFQGFKGFFTGESISFVTVEGQGDLLVNAFGRIEEIECNGSLIVDTGHVVCFEDTLNYTPRKAANSWIQSYFTGEGIALQFSGQGKILVQSHNPKEFGGSLGPMLPPRS